MRIRNACPGDVAQIVELSESCAVPFENYHHTGLVDFPVPSAEEFLRRIGSDAYFPVVVDRFLLGFCAAYPAGFVRSLEEDGIVGRICSLGDGFVYVDQLCVRPEFRRQGLAYNLLRIVEDSSRLDGFEDLFAVTCHEPLNQYTFNFLHKHRYDVVDEFSVDRLVFGLYNKKL